MREVRRAGDRFLTEGDGTRTWHSFSYGRHYDPDNLGFGALSALNVEHVDPGAGYDAHRHADVEIVTWVVEGALAHEDSTGEGSTIEPGVAQRLSAGSGVQHAERNVSVQEPLVFVQSMLRSDHVGAPRYASVEAHGAGLVRAVEVEAPARLVVARPAGARLQLPEAARTLVHVTRGEIEAAGALLAVGDELRTDEPVGRVAGDGEALVWLLDQ
ncbi:pirin family protein [Aeromicrobium sp. CF4.19]|uniref:pirin family protein n=1 Tax=Aeromicrobium sp. CF4.19 TaxID=3373082 RepID=UPI003EE689DF